jgi:hypothetical protein
VDQDRGSSRFVETVCPAAEFHTVGQDVRLGGAVAGDPDVRKVTRVCPARSEQSVLVIGWIEMVSGGLEIGEIASSILMNTGVSSPPILTQYVVFKDRF